MHTSHTGKSFCSCLLFCHFIFPTLFLLISPSVFLCPCFFLYLSLAFLVMTSSISYAGHNDISVNSVLETCVKFISSSIPLVIRDMPKQFHLREGAFSSFCQLLLQKKPFMENSLTPSLAAWLNIRGVMPPLPTSAPHQLIPVSHLSFNMLGNILLANYLVLLVFTQSIHFGVSGS